ncbi:MAG: hypothetical protein A2286_02945 [Gammaproteobacteria bacterium RIFOXYA12_FULL_61_12]|nr:MAG: hypothetical protein A2514_00790 [Gammaproteobacteria bacterium RIFOXYD12_FULL_61_37]OGT93847.1 MAG: hypothetical protein A2286_02945 [Gammaproteobacteria bacterium RIFOXYA12_FULL_61_12]
MSAEKDNEWLTADWPGVERAAIRRSLNLSVRERLEGAEQLAEVGRRFAQLRIEGRMTQRRPNRD